MIRAGEPVRARDRGGLREDRVEDVRDLEERLVVDAADAGLEVFEAIEQAGDRQVDGAETGMHDAEPWQATASSSRPRLHAFAIRSNSSGRSSGVPAGPRIKAS